MLKILLIAGLLSVAGLGVNKCTVNTADYSAGEQR
jgi:hypothetical protein